MIIFKEAKQLTSFIEEKKNNKNRIGFVPTMGALHEGHLSLINHCKKENDVTVCSIFVNPTQFNNKEDFNFYPVTTEKDIQLLISSGCDVLFLPSVKEMYPPGFEVSHFELGFIETILEGFYRPGHFQGVCLVVDRLLNIVNPQCLYLGQKDYQQCMVIKKLLSIRGKNHIQLVICETLRENGGLAMSSRNMRLSPDDLQKATLIYATLLFIKENLEKIPINDLKKVAHQQLTKNNFKVDYVEVANANTLEQAQNNQQPLVALIAATLNNVRLIDNLLLH